MNLRISSVALLIVLVGLAWPADSKTSAQRQAKNLVPNGDFEEGHITPKGWQTIDGLTMFWVKDPDPKRGKVIRLDTDVPQKQAYDWWTKIAQGASPKNAPAKTPSTDPNRGDILAAFDGVWFWSDYIPIEKDQEYWLTVDAKGPSGGMLAWLVGYPKKGSTAFGSESGAFQEAKQERVTGKKPDRGRNFEPFVHKYVWKGQLTSLLGSNPKEWKTYSRRQQPFRPTANTPSVRFVRVMLYAYWPPDEYYFDNVRLVEHPEKAK